MVEIRFKPADVGTVADGAITNVKVNAAAAIDMTKLSLAITDSEVDAAAAIVKSKLAALAIVDADVDAGAAIAKSKLEALAIVDGDVSSIGVDKVTGAVDGRAASTTGDKGVTALGYDSATEEVIIDREV